jgi:NTE family protein
MRNYFNFDSAFGCRMIPKRLVLTGGGTRCLVFVEALCVLEDAGVLTMVDSYWGTSAGAFVATLLALSGSAKALRNCMYNTDFVKFRDVDVNNLLSMNKTWGLDNGYSLMAEVERILDTVRPNSKALCMSDIPNVTMIIADISDHTLIQCSAKTYPSLPVIDAIRATMSLPLFFRPYIHKESGHIWVDGAIAANFPWMLLTPEEKQESLGFTFDHGRVATPTTISDYLLSMIHFQEPKTIQELKRDYQHNILWFPPLPFPSWFMRLTDSDFSMLRTIGADVARGWLTTSAPPSCLPSPPETTGNCRPCEDRHNPSPIDPLHRTEGTSGSPKSSDRARPQDSSRPQLPVKRPIGRRWSY